MCGPCFGAIEVSQCWAKLKQQQEQQELMSSSKLFCHSLQQQTAFGTALLVDSRRSQVVDVAGAKSQEQLRFGTVFVELPGSGQHR